MGSRNLNENIDQFRLHESEWRNIRGHEIRHRNENNYFLDHNGNIVFENDIEDSDTEFLTGGNAVPVNDFGVAIEGSINNPIIIDDYDGFFLDDDEVEEDEDEEEDHGNTFFGGENMDGDLDIVLINPEENERRLRGGNYTRS